MSGQSLAPVEKIAVVGAGRSLDFDVFLDMGLAVLPESFLLGAEFPALSFIHMPVFVHNPVSSLLWVTAFNPSSESEVEHIITGLKGPGCHCSTVVVGPSPVDAI